MRVLHLWDVYAPDLFDHSLEICREAGLDCRLVCMNFIGQPEQVPGVLWVRRLAEKGARADLLFRLGRRVRSWFDRRRFRRLVAREIVRFAPDVIHFHYGTTAALLEPVGAAFRRPFLISFYGFDISQGPQTPALRTAYQKIMQRGPLVHVLCAEAARTAVELGCPADRVGEANLPLSVELYPYIGMESERPSRWLIPARFVEKKGHEILLRAFSAHLKYYPGDRLTCWGYGDAERLRRRVAELDLELAVSVVDNEGEGRFDVAYLRQLRTHDVILAPSIRARRGDDEGGPALTAVLAQVAGKPVIVSDFPGSERSVTHGVEGLVVPQGDPVALADAMRTMAAAPDLAAEMGRRGRARTVREFSRVAYRDALLSWYRERAG
jgi:colanic acid/amylovoran biosynthesis glycosyltransferase